MLVSFSRQYCGSQYLVNYMNRKRSSEIKLLLVGAFIFTNGCSASNDYNYLNKADCISEWGVRNCEKNGSSSGGGRSFIYRDSSTTQRLNTRASSVQRSGFGSSFGKSGGRS